MEKEDVAESFPGTVAIIDDKVNNTLLHPNYRRYGIGKCDGYEYFVTQLLARLSPGRTRFCTRKHVKVISVLSNLMSI